MRAIFFQETYYYALRLGDSIRNLAGLMLLPGYFHIQALDDSESFYRRIPKLEVDVLIANTTYFPMHLCDPMMRSRPVTRKRSLFLKTRTRAMQSEFRISELIILWLTAIGR